ncbi:hypothetical protein [Desulfosporosinus meridiei]|uniref:Lipoprotein n=1 Tax=Desulfosporosinus meridiei (strain ATCC BAA-275 / DSM 13257 / KCTC 12902 / NCIMB 13706 / S10) TaxID=768704 RepID=J7ITD2_DESMD|nr:hypothetical protein [Desulfosporosinus meridiei]AFQ44965.1 hypothetical protein Desmer_3083 [Desulfosporosinus meridiei DSM 13257]
MRRVYKILLVIFLLLSLSGCADLSWTTAGKIVPPVHTICPLEGQWLVIKEMETDEKPGEDNLGWEGKNIQLSGNIALLGDYVWNRPEFKIKRVNSTNYLVTKYLNLPNELMPENKDVEVITVSSEENFIGEFMRIDEQRLIAFVQSNVLYLKKISDQVESNLVSVDQNDFIANQQSNPGSSGVLLGLKLSKESNTADNGAKGELTYQTLWLAIDHMKLHPILKGNNVFFPRNSGFWELQIRSGLDELSLEERLSAHDVSTKILDSQLKTMISRGETKKSSGRKVIEYVGNDFVVVENNLGANHLQVLPVDKISTSEGIKVSDLLGDNGSAAYSNARAQARRSLYKNPNIKSIDDLSVEQNFGLIRKNGHWYLRGRINYYLQNSSEPSYLDFNVNVVPPGKLIMYDTLCLSWQYIKDRVPEAVDAFTSPNRDMALVVTKTKLLVYSITDGQLVSEPLAKIDLPAGASVIMAEWATDFYVDNWEKAFLANGAEVMEDE